jgi:hypothetical protein
LSPQVFYSRSIRLVLGIAAVMLLTAGAASAKAPAPQVKPALHCGSGSRVVTKVVRKQGKTTVTRFCRKKATAPAAPATPPLSTTTTTTPAPIVATPAVVPTPVTPTPEPETPEAGEPEGETTKPGEPEVQAVIGTGFKQNPLVPNEVTWHYSATASESVIKNGVETTKSVPLPKGVLAFFVDGKLECEIDAGGAIAASACTVALQELGAHEVETIFSGDEGESDTASRTDLIGRYPTQTNLQVSIEPVPPQERQVGWTETLQSYPIYGFEVGRVHITGTTTPGGYPTFSCEGFGSGCLIPEESSLAAHGGSLNLPLWAKHARNPVTEKEEWHVAFSASDPALQKSGNFWQYPDESVGAYFLHVVSKPNATLYEPSSTTLPLDLRGGHYPLYEEIPTGSGGGSIAAVEGVPKKALDLGTYDKLGGGEYWLRFHGTFNNVVGESEGCRYELRIDGVARGENRRTENSHFEFQNGYGGLAPGPHDFEIWTERAAGAGPGNCQIRFGWFESYEVLH